MGHIFGKRHLEGLFHLVVLVALLSNFFGGYISNARTIHCLWVLTALAGSYVEGMRGCQVFLATLFLVYLINYAVATNWYNQAYEPTTFLNLLTWALVSAAWLQNVYLTSTLGCNDLT